MHVSMLPDFGPYGKALGAVLWGDLWLTPRGFAYVALLFTIGCALAMVRARRMYERYVAHHPRDMFALIKDDMKDATENKYQEALLNDPTNKLRAALAWAVLTFVMFAVQAHRLDRASYPAGDYAYWPDSNTVEFFPHTIASHIPYDDVTFMLGLLAAAMTGMWLVIGVVGTDYDPPFWVRAVRWLATLAAPINPNDSPNRVQRLLTRLDKQTYLRNKTHV